MDYENEEWLKEREQKLKEEKRQQNMQIVRLILGGYLIYLAHLAALEAEKEKSESGDTASDKDDGWGYRPEPPEAD